MDFGALPPEINSARMYSGPGSGPLLAAATAWEGLSAELISTASGYDAVVSGLTGEAWSGPAAASMAAAAAPYAAWMGSTASQAEQAAIQARTAAAAYDVAFATTVPPPVVAANRSLLLSLIATNVLGQNTAAIAAAELHYAEMWAQDAGAMYGYAGASASATALTPFAAAPSTTNLTGLGAQAAAATQAGAGASAQSALSQLIAMVPQALQGLAISGPSAAADSAQALPVLDFLAGPLSPISLFGIGGVPYLLAIQAVLLPMNGSNVIASVARAQGPKPWLDEQALGTAEAGTGTRLVSVPGPMASAGVGNSGSVGRMSVPPSWAAATSAATPTGASTATSAARTVASMVAADTQGGLMSNLAMGGLAGRAIGATGGAASRAIDAPTGSLAGSKPSKATIIVIPPSAQD